MFFQIFQIIVQTFQKNRELYLYQQSEIRSQYWIILLFCSVEFVPVSGYVNTAAQPDIRMAFDMIKKFF